MATVLYIPKRLPRSVALGNNLITDANNGTFSDVLSGIPNTSPPIEPYPGLCPEFVYEQLAEGGTLTNDTYTITNTMADNEFVNGGYWWPAADRTGTPLSSMMVLHAVYKSNTSFFKTTVPVDHNTDYLFSFWALNLIRESQPNPTPAVFKLRVQDENGGFIGGDITIPEVVPPTATQEIWYQCGVVVNSGNNSQLTLQIITVNPADFAIDNVCLQGITGEPSGCLGPFESISNETQTEIVDLDLVKTSCPYTIKGKDICYTVTASNNSDIDIERLLFSDKLPDSTVYVPYTFFVDGESQTPMMADNTIQYLLNIPAGESVEIKFCVRVESS